MNGLTCHHLRAGAGVKLMALGNPVGQSYLKYGKRAELWTLADALPNVILCDASVAKIIYLVL